MSKDVIKSDRLDPLGLTLNSQTSLIENTKQYLRDITETDLDSLNELLVEVRKLKIERDLIVKMQAGNSDRMKAIQCELTRTKAESASWERLAREAGVTQMP